MFDWLKKKKKPSVKGGETALEVLAWRTHMWVMTPDGIGIIFKLGVESEVHLTCGEGYTTQSKVYPITALRQAKIHEIPKGRLKCSKEQAHTMGYF